MMMLPAPHRVAVVSILAVLMGGLGVFLYSHQATVADPPDPAGVHADELFGTLDPNTADAGSLSALPGLGEKRAAAVVEYRQRRQRATHEAVIFRRPSDLLPVDGIGPSMASNLTPLLRFPTDRHNPTSR